MRMTFRTSLVVQWLRLYPPNAGVAGSIPHQGTKIPHATRCSQKKKWAKKFLRISASTTLGAISTHFDKAAASGLRRC